MCLDAIGKLVPTVQGGCTSPNALSTPLWFAAACPILSIDSGCSPVKKTSTASMATIRYNLTKYNYKSWWSWLISSMARRGILGNDNRLKMLCICFVRPTLLMVLASSTCCRPFGCQRLSEIKKSGVLFFLIH